MDFHLQVVLQEIHDTVANMMFSRVALLAAVLFSLSCTSALAATSATDPAGDQCMTGANGEACGTDFVTASDSVDAEGNVRLKVTFAGAQCQSLYPASVTQPAFHVFPASSTEAVEADSLGNAWAASDTTDFVWSYPSSTGSDDDIPLAEFLAPGSAEVEIPASIVASLGGLPLRWFVTNSCRSHWSDPVYSDGDRAPDSGLYTVSAPPATVAVSPSSGPVGTVVSLSGSAPQCNDEAAADAEVFLLVGNFAGSASINPRILVETASDGSFSGTWSMPDPATSSAYSGATTYEVKVRCVGSDGVHDTGDINEVPATFTYTVDVCPNLAGAQALVPAGYALWGGKCLPVAISGSAGANTLVGNALANVIKGLGGNDRLYGRGGNDSVRGGAGSDQLLGEAGKDRLFGDAGTDTARGGGGPDTVTGGAGRDKLYGDAGNDVIDGRDRKGGDLVNGGAGKDTCFYNRGDTVIGCEKKILRS